MICNLSIQYGARYGKYKFLNFFSGQPIAKANHYIKGPKHCEIPPPSDFIPEASRLWTTTPKYIGKARSSRERPIAEVELYDLHADPFESTNLAEQYSKHAGIIKEIRAWAEAEIGRNPPLAVVGQWNLAYQTMIQAAYPKLGYKSPFAVISRDWPVDFDEKNSQNYDLQAFKNGP